METKPLAIRVGKRGTSPVCRYSRKTGTKRIRAASISRPAKKPKKDRGRQVRRSRVIMRMTRIPSGIVFSLESLPSGRSL